MRKEGETKVDPKGGLRMKKCEGEKPNKPP